MLTRQRARARYYFLRHTPSAADASAARKIRAAATRARMLSQQARAGGNAARVRRRCARAGAAVRAAVREARVRKEAGKEARGSKLTCAGGVWQHQVLRRVLCD